MATIIVDRYNPNGINGAIASSNEGDIILVKDGNYPNFTVTKNNLTLVADGKNVVIDGRLSDTPDFPDYGLPTTICGSSTKGISNPSSLEAQVPLTNIASMHDVEIKGFTFIYTNFNFLYCTHCRLIENKFFDSPGNAIDLYNCSKMLILNNEVFHSVNNGIDVGGGSSPFNWIVGNYVSDSGRNGISINYENNAVIQNRVVNSNGTGIVVLGISNLIYSNSIQQNSSVSLDTGILLNNGGNFVIYNDIKKDMSDGLKMNGDNNFAALNEIEDNNGNGIIIDGNFSIAENNKIESNEVNGILAGGSYNSIFFNKIKHNKKGDIENIGTNNNISDNNRNFRDC